MVNDIRFIDMFGGVGGFRLGLERANLDCIDRSKNRRGKGSNEKDVKRRERLDTQERKTSNQKKRWENLGSSDTVNSGTFTCVGYYEIDKYAVQTYNKNFKENNRPRNIREVDWKQEPDFDLICAGFPCQSFSLAGKRKGFQDTRGTLFFEICRAARAKRPKMLLLENVKGLLSHDEGTTFATILRCLDELGYDAEWQVLNSKDFGIPQNRERVFIVGHLRGGSRPKIFPIRESGKLASKRNLGAVTANYWKGNYTGSYVEKIQEVKKYGTDSMEREIHKSGTGDDSNLCDNEGKQIHRQLCGRQGEGNKDSPIKRHKNKLAMIHNVYGGFKEGIRVFEEVSPTIRTPKGGGHLPMVIEDFYPDRVREYENESPTLRGDRVGLKLKNADRIRRLTPTECERLQGFPDNWTKGVSDTQRYKQMGNAVTVNVIEAIGGRILTFLS